jgi:hypothetical protein
MIVGVATYGVLLRRGLIAVIETISGPRWCDRNVPIVVMVRDVSSPYPAAMLHDAPPVDTLAARPTPAPRAMRSVSRGEMESTSKSVRRVIAPKKEEKEEQNGS